MKRASHHDQLSSWFQPTSGPGLGSLIMASNRSTVASIITAVLVLVTVVFFTPLLTALPQAALGAIIIVAVVNLIDVREMRHIAYVKRSDLVGLVVAFTATLTLGIELGILVAVVEYAFFNFDYFAGLEFTAGYDPVTRLIVEHGGLFAYNKARLAGEIQAQLRRMACR